MYHDDAVAHALDISRVVRGEQQRHAVALGFGAQQLPDRRLGGYVETDRGLVEKQQSRRVEHTGDNFAAHPLAEGELTDRRIDERAEAEERDQFVHPPAVTRRIDFVHAPQQGEGVARRELIPELRALPEDRADAECERVTLARPHEAEAADVARVGTQDGREDFQRRRFSGAVGPDERNRSPARTESDRPSTATTVSVCGAKTSRTRAATPLGRERRTRNDLVSPETSTAGVARMAAAPWSARRNPRKSETPLTPTSANSLRERLEIRQDPRDALVGQLTRRDRRHLACSFAHDREELLIFTGERHEARPRVASSLGAVAHLTDTVEIGLTGRPGILLLDCRRLLASVPRVRRYGNGRGEQPHQRCEETSDRPAQGRTMLACPPITNQRIVDVGLPP